jgi:hypothetical protein
LEGLNVRLIFSEGETARLSGQMSMAADYKISMDFARPAATVPCASATQKETNKAANNDNIAPFSRFRSEKCRGWAGNCAVVAYIHNNIWMALHSDDA